VDLFRFTQQNGADVILFEVQHHGAKAIFKLEKFTRLGFGQSVDARYTVAHRKHCADFF
jgi:hypothetical protein